MDVFLKGDEVATRNLTPGISVYGEELITEDVEYRLWNPRRSKLSAAILNGLSSLKIENDYKILYLGASTGTTVSHISDIAYNGKIYAVEFSPVTAKKLTRLSRQRPNIYPILADATKPKEYMNIIEKVDFMDFREALLKHSEKKKIVGQAGLNGRVIYRLIKEE